MQNFIKIREDSIKFLCEDKFKEWQCHVQFVEKIAVELAERYAADKHIVSISAILHDIGRDKEVAGEDHRETGMRLAKFHLAKYNLPKKEIDLIIKCVGNHGGDIQPTTQEERIIISSDCASKLIYHQAFMLMVNKTTFNERAEWGLKYLEKGYSKIQFPDYKNTLKSIYTQLKEIYIDVLNHA